VAAIVDGGDGQPAVRVPAGDTDDETGRLVAVSAGLSAGAYVEGSAVGRFGLANILPTYGRFVASG
jgi:hypothetical protein